MRITLLIVAVISLFFLAVIWSAGWFFGLSVSVEVGLSVLLVLAAVTFVAVVYLLRLHAASRLERGLLAQNKEAESSAPDRRHELLALQKQVATAISALKKSRLAQGGRTALYALPWYLIVGPPGTGKTTAIRHSGLNFPLDEGGGASAYRGSGGTRNCDWWFTNEAILLDTAGRWSTDGEDQQEWFMFLDLLKKNRPKKPLNGLIVAISLGDLLRSTSEQVSATARQMRVRIDEVTTRLKMVVPVYVLFTKTDMVAGFSEFWGDLRKSERGQVWGMGFAKDKDSEGDAHGDTRDEPGPNFEREFDSLLDVLQARAVRRLHAERHVETRRLLWMFPLEFAAVRAPISSFVTQLFQRNAYQETLLLRGLYFTSGTQTVRPMSRVIGAMAATFGVQLPSPVGATVEPKSFFLTDVFRQVMVGDRNLAGQTRDAKRRQFLLRFVLAGMALLLAAMLDGPAAVAFLRNRELLVSTSAIAAAMQAANWADASALEKNVTHLDLTQARLRELFGWKQEGPPAALRWGMYVGNDLYPALRGAYVTAVSRAAVQRATAGLEDRLRAMDAGPARTTENFNRDFDALKLYLMLGDVAHMDPGWAAPQLVRDWHPAPPADVSATRDLVPHIAYAFELMARREVSPWSVDGDLVVRARSILTQVPRQERVYEALVRDANTEVAPIRRESVFYGSVAQYVQSRRGIKVDGAYTKQGWLRVRALLGKERQKLEAEQWVLGDTDSAGAQVEKLRDVYFERYRNAWRDFLADLQVQDPGSAEVALDEIDALSEPEWPYLRLIRLLGENVKLELSDPDTPLDTLVGKALDKAKELFDAASPKSKEISPVERAFRPLVRFGLSEGVKDSDSAPPTGLSQYEALLAKVAAALTDLRDAQSGTDPRKVSDVFQDAFRSTSALLSEQDGLTRPLLSPLLMNPITFAWSNVVHDAGAAAGSSWESSVWQKWHDKLEGKYPFAASPSDASLNDFFDFFAPGEGVLWSFFDESLKPTLERRGSSFVPSRRFKSAIGYTGDFLEICLKKGQEFTTTLFPPKADHAAVVFDVNLHSVSPTIGQVTFEVDGASHTYRNEPEQWTTITWPGKTPHGARLRVRGASGLDEEINRPGDFGLFRLLDAADIKPGRAGGRADGAPTLVATWGLKAARDSAVSLDLRPSRNENPLNPGFFKNYNCPRVITTK
jgi:type VI secretion system protein ImpL